MNHERKSDGSRSGTTSPALPLAGAFQDVTLGSEKEARTTKDSSIEQFTDCASASSGLQMLCGKSLPDDVGGAVVAAGRGELHSTVDTISSINNTGSMGQCGGNVVNVGSNPSPLLNLATQAGDMERRASEPLMRSGSTSNQGTCQAWPNPSLQPPTVRPHSAALSQINRAMSSSVPPMPRLAHPIHRPSRGPSQAGCAAASAGDAVMSAPSGGSMATLNTSSKHTRSTNPRPGLPDPHALLVYFQSLALAGNVGAGDGGAGAGRPSLSNMQGLGGGQSSQFHDALAGLVLQQQQQQQVGGMPSLPGAIRPPTAVPSSNNMNVRPQLQPSLRASNRHSSALLMQGPVYNTMSDVHIGNGMHTGFTSLSLPHMHGEGYSASLGGDAPYQLAQAQQRILAAMLGENMGDQHGMHQAGLGSPDLSQLSTLSSPSPSSTMNTNSQSLAVGPPPVGAVTPAPSASSASSASLYVKNLPPEADELYLYQKFAPHGALMSCKIMADPTTGRCRGVGFVNYSNQQCALRALHHLHGSRISEGRQMHVVLQAPRAVRAAAAAAIASTPSHPLPPPGLSAKVSRDRGEFGDGGCAGQGMMGMMDAGNLESGPSPQPTLFLGQARVSGSTPERTIPSDMAAHSTSPPTTPPLHPASPISSHVASSSRGAIMTIPTSGAGACGEEVCGVGPGNADAHCEPVGGHTNSGVAGAGAPM